MPAKRRAEKLGTTELHLGTGDKFVLLNDFIERRNLTLEEVAYIGDDTNDVEVMRRAGVSAYPADATPFARAVADHVCESKGGYGAFRDLAELIIAHKNGPGC
jgi:3-deoxy-D-manno-octulosonate 8-phosphate phosphatase (KDO 8-P phosphatase)